MVRSAQSGKGHWISDAIGAARQRIARHQTYRRALGKLAALSDGELKRLGLSREMIRAVARQAAQAA